MNYTEDLNGTNGITQNERSFLFYLCDALKVAPRQAPRLLKIAEREDYEQTDAYKKLIAYLMTIPTECIQDEEKKLRKALI